MSTNPHSTYYVILRCGVTKFSGVRLDNVIAAYTRVDIDEWTITDETGRIVARKRVIL